jgi:preprotein translocase subunit YajC
MLVGIIVIFYFFMIRPQQKRQKDLRKQREAMGKGDTVVTAGGIFGKIREVRDDSFMIEIDQNVKIRVDKNSVYPSAADAAADAQQKQ